MNWFYYDGSREVGPVSPYEMIILIACGIIKRRTAIRRDQMNNWVIADSIPTLCALFDAAEQPILPLNKPPRYNPYEHSNDPIPNQGNRQQAPPIYISDDSCEYKNLPLMYRAAPEYISITLWLCFVCLFSFCNIQSYLGNFISVIELVVFLRWFAIISDTIKSSPKRGAKLAAFWFFGHFAYVCICLIILSVFGGLAVDGTLITLYLLLSGSFAFIDMCWLFANSDKLPEKVRKENIEQKDKSYEKIVS